ncbi:EF-hand domain-containing protein [Orrella marina]|nr:EF-hand domain-containing protein [Orrella marina]
MTMISKKVAQTILASTFIVPWTAAWAASDLPAAPQNKQEVVERFTTADKDGDGKVTREEAEQGMPRVAKSWDRIDQDNKGYITLEQLLVVLGVND